MGSVIHEIAYETDRWRRPYTDRATQMTGRPGDRNLHCARSEYCGEFAAMDDTEITAAAKKRKSGIPTGNAGEYFVMGELLRRGFDAQLADRNTKGYDLLVGRAEEPTLRKVQVKTVRSQPWYVNTGDFTGEILDRITIYVLLGSVDSKKPVRFFIARNRDIAERVHRPSGWKQHGFMQIRAVEQYEIDGMRCWADSVSGWWLQE